MAYDHVEPERAAVSGRLYGKYRGRVTDNVDPLNLARLLVDVPAVPDSTDTWAMPCVPYAGTDGRPVGLHAIPPVGAHVWVEFEGGDPSYPIWTGCYWEEDEFPDAKALEDEEPPLVKMLQTAAAKLVVDDKEGEGSVELELDAPAVDEAVTMRFDQEGVTVTCGVSKLTLHPKDGITLTVSDTTVSLTEDSIEMRAGTIRVQSEQALTLEAGADLAMEASKAASLKAGSGLDLESGAGTSVQAGGQLSASAGTAAKVEAGATLDLNAGATLTVKGALVSIN